MLRGARLPGPASGLLYQNDKLFAVVATEKMFKRIIIRAF
jgi:hypothetical protein